MGISSSRALRVALERMRREADNPLFDSIDLASERIGASGAKMLGGALSRNRTVIDLNLFSERAQKRGDAYSVTCGACVRVSYQIMRSARRARLRSRAR
jgi:hypothetical protein